MEYKKQNEKNYFLKEKIELEMNNLKKYNEELKKAFTLFIDERFEVLNQHFFSILTDIDKTVNSNFSRYSNLDEHNNSLENQLEDLRSNLISKNKEIIELETERKNWNKVSYTKFLDKQLSDKKKDLDIMKMRFDHVTKQNNEYRQKMIELKNKIKDLCESNNIEIDIDVSDNISIPESNTEISIIESHEDGVDNASINMVVTEKNDNDEQEILEENTNDNDIKETMKNDCDERKNNSDSEDTVSTSSSLLEGYELYYHLNKKSNKEKKYLKKKEGKKVYLFKYTKESENVGEPVGQIIIKEGNEKASFYRKKKH